MTACDIVAGDNKLMTKDELAQIAQIETAGKIGAGIGGAAGAGHGIYNYFKYKDGLAGEAIPHMSELNMFETAAHLGGHINRIKEAPANRMAKLTKWYYTKSRTCYY